MDSWQERQANSSGHQELVKTLVPALDALIVASGLLGHSLVVTVLAGRRRRRRGADGRPHPSTDALLLGLSAADLLLLLCLPFHTAAIALGFWPFGGFLCKAVSFLGVACSSASVFTLAALAVSRYVVVVHPAWAYRSGARRHAPLAVALLWLPAAALAAPQFAFRTLRGHSAVHCFAFLSDVSQGVYSGALFLFAFALPLAVITVMYANIYRFLRRARLLAGAPQLERYQRQVTHTSALLVVVFTLLWLPSYALMFSFVGGGAAAASHYRAVAVVARLLASSATVANPVLYVFMSRRFRRELVALGRECWAGVRRHVIGCLDGGRDAVQPFKQDTTSEGEQP